ncbi:hypothetical protein DDZ14_07560 [Maritimibacter sp. 55A14]|uniref:glycosyltransferase family 39 protein n=1 Tax=Maritimibacter sp. 55A14 TaxID=2174844 RepID=UPI000D60F9DB|nr:glycosyltransferase family 39 protein [Maritimibacter sp. 55A14]PWE32939.1 hypothetical protein DDZ14_07560 [Maritimibacter sp. 55A14]
MRERRQSGRDHFWLAALLVLAAALRLPGLNAPLWFDEIVTIQTHLTLPWAEMMQDYSMNHHYLFSLQSKAAAALFGMEIWAIRLPAFLFGVATVGAIWWLARQVAGPVTAHLAGFLTAISYHQVWFSQNARGYTELAFWSTLGMILFLRGMETPRRAVWIGYGVTLAAAVCTHLTGAFFFAAQGLVWLGAVIWLAARGRLGRGQVGLPLLGYVLGAALTLAFYAPVLPGVLETVQTVSGTSAVDVMQEYQNPLWTVVEGVRTALGGTGRLAPFLAAAAALTALVGIAATQARAPLFAPVVVVHIALTIGLLTAVGMRVWPRFFFADIGFLTILAFCGASVIAGALARGVGRPQAGGGLFAVLVVGMIGVSALLLPRNYTMPKQDLAGAYSFVEATRREGERVISVGYSGPIFTGFFGADWGNVNAPEEYAQAMAAPGPVAVVVPFPERSFRAIPALDEELGESLRIERILRGTLGDGNIIVLRRD